MIKEKRARVGMIIAALGFAIVGATAQTSGAPHGNVPGQAASNAAPKRAEEQFKNIQVLKGIPADQLIPSMQFIQASLGVECEFCHVHNAFEKDDKKPKQAARKMMEMMFAINKDSFEGNRAVTCNSCHRGSPKPQAIPAVMAEDTKAPAMVIKPVEVKTGGGPSADSLIEKYVQAVGGAAAIEKVSSRVMKGTIDFGGKSLPIDIYSKDPDKRISFTHLPEGESITAFDGRDGWLGTPGRPAHEMHGSELDAASMDADLHFATHLKAMFSAMQVEGPERIGDRDAYVVVGKREGKTPIRLYFDEQSGFLLRLVRFGDSALGWLPTQIDYADYRDTNGLKIPYRWTLARPSGRFTIQVSEMKQNIPVDDSKFAKPPAEGPKGPGM